MKKNSSPRKNKKVKRRLNVKRVFILAFILGLLALIISILLQIEVKSVDVKGTNYVSDASIIKSAGLTDKQYFFKINDSVCKKIKENKMINTCQINKKFGFKIVIEITENRPLFFYTSTNKLVLSNGVELDEANTYGVPNLINFVPENILKKFVSGLDGIKSDIIMSTSEIEYTPSQNKDGSYIDQERFMLSMKDGNYVYINIRNMKVLNKYEQIYSSTGDKKGYYNLDSDTDSYYFKEFETKKSDEEE